MRISFVDFDCRREHLVVRASGYWKIADCQAYESDIQKCQEFRISHVQILYP